MVKAIRGVLVQADESVMAIIKQIDSDRKGSNFIIQDLDDETCLVAPEKLEELERLVKAKIKQHLPEVEDDSSVE